MGRDYCIFDPAVAVFLEITQVSFLDSRGHKEDIGFDLFYLLFLVEVDGVHRADLDAFPASGASLEVYGIDVGKTVGIFEVNGLCRPVIEGIGYLYRTHLGAPVTGVAGFPDSPGAFPDFDFQISLFSTDLDNL